MRAALAASARVVAVFPGQGSQTVGMGRALAAAFPLARHVFDEVDDALQRPLSRIMFDGPEVRVSAGLLRPRGGVRRVFSGVSCRVVVALTCEAANHRSVDPVGGALV
jgi:malonyl CoA-acyl carrier protein transacylase